MKNIELNTCSKLVLVHKTGAVVSLPFQKQAHLTIHLQNVFQTVNHIFNNADPYMPHKAKTLCYFNT